MPVWRNTAFAFGLCLWLTAGQSAAETSDWVTDPFERGAVQADDKPYGFSDGNFVVAPIPFSNPSIGSGLALGGGYLFKLSPEARTSVLGVGAMRTNNGSDAYGALINLAFSENRWLVKLFAGVADLRYDLITDLADIPLRQDGNLVNVALAYGVTPQLSFGAELRYFETSVGLGGGGLGLPPEILPDAKLELATLALTGDFDRRDDTDYPNSGFRLYGEFAQGFALNADERRYEKGFARLDGFYPLFEQTVLGGRAVACQSSSDTPFFDKCSLGLTDNFRGFNSTRFLDDRLVSFQVELRQRFSRRFGGVAFAGAGWSGESFEAAFDNGLNAAGGLGVRYRVSRNFPVDFSVDVARNDRSDSLLYIYVGQRF